MKVSHKPNPGFEDSQKTGRFLGQTNKSGVPYKKEQSFESLGFGFFFFMVGLALAGEDRYTVSLTVLHTLLPLILPSFTALLTLTSPTSEIPSHSTGSLLWHPALVYRPTNTKVKLDNMGFEPRKNSSTTFLVFGFF